jgi:hypothetical protein
MATITPSRAQTQNTKAFVQQWVNMGNGDEGAPLGNSQYTDRSAQVVGFFGGASVVIEGTNNGTNWATLTDLQGNPLSFTTEKIELVAEATLQIRPRVVGGDVSTDLSVYLLVKE